MRGDRRNTVVANPQMRLPVGLTGDDVNALTAIARYMAECRCNPDEHGTNGDPAVLAETARDILISVREVLAKGFPVNARLFAIQAGAGIAFAVSQLDAQIASRNLPPAAQQVGAAS